MNLPCLLDSAFCARLMLTFGHFLWQGALIFGVAVVASRLLRRGSAEARYRVLVAGLVLMALCPVGTFVWVGGPEGPAVVPVVAQEPVPGRDVERVVLVPGPEVTGERPIRVVAEPVGSRTAEAPSLREPVTPVRPRFDWRRYAGHVVVVYLLGACAMLGRLGLALCGGQRLRRRSEPVQDGAILLALSRQARALGLRFTPAIACCKQIVVPTVIGVLRPMILLPLSFASSLTPEQIEVLLAHELAHIRRYDHLVNLLQRLIEAALFFHPAVWLLSRRIRIEREHCCDDMVVAGGGRRFVYAESLVRVAEMSLAGGASRSIVAAAAVGADGQAGQLGKRIMRLIESPSHERVHLRRTWMLVVPVLAMAALTLGRLAPARQAEIAGGPVATQPAASPAAQRALRDKTGAGGQAQLLPLKGMVVQIKHTRGVVSDAKKRFEEIGALGADTVLITTPILQENASSKSFELDPDVNPTPEQWREILQIAHDSGLRVVLVPFILLSKPRETEWRGVINPPSWDEWFEQYTKSICSFARLAAENHVEVFSVGSELVSTERYTDRWRKVISEVRKVYPGKLTYSANWEHYKAVQFWGDVDLIGMSSYYRLSDAPSPSMEALMKAWAPIRRSILAWQKQVDKPLLFTEVGYCSQEGASIEPWNGDRKPGSTADALEEQRRCYRAFIDTWKDTPELGGIIWWCWPANEVGDWDRAYSPRGKPAEQELRRWFERSQGDASDVVNPARRVESPATTEPPRVTAAPARSESSGTIVAVHGSAGYGSDGGYDKNQYRGRLSSGEKIELRDAQVRENEFNIFIINVKRVPCAENEWLARSSGDPIVWVTLADTSFADRYDPVTNTVLAGPTPGKTPTRPSSSTGDDGRSGTVTAYTSVCGSDVAYAQRLYLNSLYEGDKIILLDKRVAANARANPVIKIQMAADSRDKSFAAGRVGWVELGSTSFVDRYDPATRTILDQPGATRPASPGASREASEVAVTGPAAGGLGGVLRLPDGSPAKAAAIYPAFDTHGVYMKRERTTGRSIALPGASDESGHFVWPASFADAPALFIYHDGGYAVVTREQLKSSAEVKLTAWGRIEGSIFINGKPGGQDDLALQYEPEIKYRPEPILPWDVGPVMTAPGRFVYERVPGGRAYVCRAVKLEPLHGGPGGSGKRERYGYPDSQCVRILPGQTARANLGEFGRPVVGRLVFPAGAEVVTDTTMKTAASTVSLFWTPPFMDALERMSRGEQDAWLADEKNREAFQRFEDSIKQYLVVIDAEGRFRIDDVTPGTYKLVAHLQLKDPKASADQVGPFVQPMLRDVVVPETSGGRAGEPLDLGDVKLKADDLKKPPAATQPSTLPAGQRPGAPAGQPATAPAGHAVTRPASSEQLREGLARLEREKTVEALNHLLELNGVRVSGIEKIGNGWPGHPNESAGIHDVNRIRSDGTDYVVVVACRYSDDPNMRGLISSGWGMAFFFREQGALEGYVGGQPGEDGLNGDKVFLVTLGTSDRWFAWVTRFEKREPFTFRSEVYLVAPGLPRAFRVHHYPNSTAWSDAPPYVLPGAPYANYFWFKDEKDKIKLGDRGVGSDGKLHDMFVRWDPQAGVFRGASRVTFDGKPVYEVDLERSPLFRPTDVAEAGETPAPPKRPAATQPATQAAGGVASSLAWGQAVDGVRLGAAAAEAIQERKGPVLIRYTLENKGAKMMRFYGGPSLGIFGDFIAWVGGSIEVVGPDGAPVEPSGGVPFPSPGIDIAPGGTHTGELDLARYFHFDRPGEYRVTLRLRPHPSDDIRGKRSIEVTSGEFSVVLAGEAQAHAPTTRAASMPAEEAPAATQPGRADIDMRGFGEDMTGESALEVHIIDSNKEPAGGYWVAHWREATAAERAEIEKPPSRPQLRGPETGFHWRDANTGKIWIQVMSAGATESGSAIVGFRAGNYRVTAGRYRQEATDDPTPAGISDAVQLDGRASSRGRLTVRLSSGVPLTVRIADATTGQRIENMRVLLSRADGIPVGWWNGVGQDGAMRYTSVAPGRYVLHALRAAHLCGELDHETTLPLEVKADGRNEIDLPIKGRVIPEAEVRERWPWVATGTIRDAQGRPMAGVRVVVNCGIGTLWPKGQAVSGPDGKYLLRFGPGWLVGSGKRGEHVAGTQAAWVAAYKDGFTERNNSGQGHLYMALQRPGEGDFYCPEPDKAILPGKPYTVDFVMVPNAPPAATRAAERISI